MARPRKDFTDRDYTQIETLAGYGLSLPQIAAVMGVSETEFHYRKSEKRVSEALESGKAKAQGNVGKALYLRAIDGDVNAIRWWEMTRAKRRATQPENEDGKTEQVLTVRVERAMPVEVKNES